MGHYGRPHAMGMGHAGDRERVFVAFIARRHYFIFGGRAVREKWLYEK